MPVLEQIFDHAAIELQLGREVVVKVGLGQTCTLGDHRRARTLESLFRKHRLGTREQLRLVVLADLSLAPTWPHFGLVVVVQGQGSDRFGFVFAHGSRWSRIRWMSMCDRGAAPHVGIPLFRAL
jgi:hypothetical protein